MRYFCLDYYLIMRYIWCVKKGERKMATKQFSKKELKIQYLSPKTELKKVRRSQDITTLEMSKVIGVSREHYEKKEAGKFPFQDYEMFLISRRLNESITKLFF